jgi:hypothetical protein
VRSAEGAKALGIDSSLKRIKTDPIGLNQLGISLTLKKTPNLDVHGPKNGKFDALPKSIFFLLPGRNNIAVRNDYVTNHIVCE